MEDNEKTEHNSAPNNNISVSKPVFALIIVVMIAAVCYASYCAGYMRGMEKAGNNGAVREIAAPKDIPQEAPEDGPQAGPDGGNGSADRDFGDIFRDMSPFNADDNSGPNGNRPEGKSGDEGREQAQGAFLDIMGTTVTEEARDSYNLPAGVLVMKVSEDGAADKAGIKDHSVITAVDGVKVSAMEDLKGYLTGKNPGDRVSISLYEPTEDHRFEQRTVDVTLSDGEAVSKDR